jgi:hypothetical protein
MSHHEDGYEKGKSNLPTRPALFASSFHLFREEQLFPELSGAVL